jgi:hypothetical protein
MGRDARSSRIGRMILLVALAIQGVTPDFRNLSSPWLLRILDWEMGDLAFGKDSEPLPVENHDDGPSDVCAPGSMHNSLRLHRDSVGRLAAEFTPIGPSERLIRSSVLSFHPHILARHGGDDLIRSLCRFLC